MIGGNYQVNLAENAREQYSGLSTVPIAPKSPAEENVSKADVISKDYADAIRAYNVPLKFSKLPQTPSLYEAVRYVETNKRFGYFYRITDTVENGVGGCELDVYNKKGRIENSYRWQGGRKAENYVGHTDYIYDGLQSKPTRAQSYHAGCDKPYEVMECYEYIPDECFTAHELNKKSSAKEFAQNLKDEGINFKLQKISPNTISFVEYDENGFNNLVTDFNKEYDLNSGRIVQHFLTENGSEERRVILKDDCTEIYNYGL